jgi:hypothetical protein
MLGTNKKLKKLNIPFSSFRNWKARACLNQMQDLENWINQSDQHNKNQVWVEGVRIRKNTKAPENRPGNNYISQFLGQLKYNSDRRIFHGEFNQIFSDRYIDDQPFARDKYDRIKLEITVTGSITFVLTTWTNERFQFQGECKNGFLVGFDDDGLYWVLDFFKQSAAA